MRLEEREWTKSRNRCEGGKFQGSLKRQEIEQVAAQVEVAPLGTSLMVPREKEAMGLVR